MSIFGKIGGRVRRQLTYDSLKREIQNPFPLAGVAGAGKWRNPKAMIIQDRPGAGHLQGLFARRAARQYRKILGADGIREDEIFVTSAIKTQPGAKAPSEAYEMRLWQPFLEREMQIVKPGKILVIGRVARMMVQNIRGSRRGTASISNTKKKAS